MAEILDPYLLSPVQVATGVFHLCSLTLISLVSLRIKYRHWHPRDYSVASMKTPSHTRGGRQSKPVPPGQQAGRRLTA